MQIATGLHVLPGRAKRPPGHFRRGSVVVAPRRAFDATEAAGPIVDTIRGVVEGEAPNLVAAG